MIKLLPFLLLTLSVFGQTQQALVVLPGAPPGGIGSNCAVPALFYGNLSTGVIAGCVGGVWTAIGGGSGSGDFVGPGSATDKAAVRFNGTTGKLGQNSLLTIDDSGNASTPGGYSAGVGGSLAGVVSLGQGTPPSIVANTAIRYAGASVTGYTLRELSTAGNGIPFLTNTANDMVTTLIAGTASDCVHVDGSSASCGGAYASSKGAAGTIAMDTTDVVVYTFSSVPALTAGSCYTISAIVGNTSVTFTIKIKVGGTTVATPVTAFSAGYYYKFQMMYCNDAAVQNAQHNTYLDGSYETTANFTSGTNTAWVMQIGDTTYKAATANIDWSSAQTVTVTVTAASGTVDRIFARIGQ